MYNVFAPVFASHLRRSLATNSGPLSDRRCSGTPFITITSARAPMILALDQRRSARTIAGENRTSGAAALFARRNRGGAREAP